MGLLLSLYNLLCCIAIARKGKGKTVVIVVVVLYPFSLGRKYTNPFFLL